jgi:hypothetical protein
MDDGERALLAETVRDAIAGATAGTQAGTVGPVDAVLGDLGWLDMLDAEPSDAIASVFTALGATNAKATALDDVVVSALGIPPRPNLAVLLPPFATWDPPAVLAQGPGRARGIATARVTTADELVVVGDAGSERRAVLVLKTNAAITAVRGIDPDAGMSIVEMVDIDAGTAGITLEPRTWDGAVAVGRRAVAHQIAGASRAMLDLARLHALERVQFGRPVARFQAVRHRLAEALVAIEALEASLAAAADEPTPDTAALAKAVAGRTARTVAAHCQQVLAGVGFTTDHPFHRLLKRTMLLDGLFGSSDAIVVDLGRRLLATRTVPNLIEL